MSTVPSGALADRLRRLCALALHVLWPVSCPICGRLGEVLCGGCLSALLAPPPERCLLCGDEVPCLRHPNAPVVRAASPYEGDVQAGPLREREVHH